VFLRDQEKKKKRRYIFFSHNDMRSRISILLNIVNNKVKIEKVIQRSAEVQEVHAYIQIIELQCKRYRLKIRRNSVGVL